MTEIPLIQGRMGQVLILVLALGLSACSTDLHTKVSGNLDQMSKSQTVAILPVEIQDEDQAETAEVLRRSLFANLRQSHFEVLEPYVVDALLKRHGLKDSGQYWEENPRRFAEILGVDAVVLSRINRIETSYLLVHSSIEVSVSAHMIDTRSGEILWWAEQTQKDFEGIGKIPTGMAAAVYGPVLFVADRFKVNEMTTKMVHKMTALVRSPEQANQDTRFEQPMIASAWNREAPEGETVHWAKVGPTQQTAPAVPVAGGLNEQLAPPPSELVVETREKTADRTLDEAIASPTFLSAPEPVAGEVQGPRRPSGRVPEGQESQEPGHPSVWF